MALSVITARSTSSSGSTSQPMRIPGAMVLERLPMEIVQSGASE
ncbi:hypothetical protein RAH42_00010 [Pyramidobacter sp. YE332]|nr:hypothetical protein [Pyramidobacter sp. YE332]WOL40044.1 hypothetical protein RAH42_00010 [Pyramidobacter sp. YE332]